MDTTACTQERHSAAHPLSLCRAELLAVLLAHLGKRLLGALGRMISMIRWLSWWLLREPNSPMAQSGLCMLTESLSEVIFGCISDVYDIYELADAKNRQLLSFRGHTHGRESQCQHQLRDVGPHGVLS